MRPIKHGRGLIRNTPHGTYRAELNHAYKKHRRTFRTLDAARAWLDLLQIELMNTEQPLTALEIRDARNALNLLPPGASLTDAARAWTQHHGPATPQPIETLITQFLLEKEHLGLRPKSLQILTYACNRLKNALPGVHVHEITTNRLAAILTSAGIQGATWNNHRRDWSNFFNWCIQHQHLRANPAAALPRARRDQILPGILTLDQTHALLTAATNTPLRAYVTLGLFAGIRPDECHRITWTAITPEHIHIGPAAAKMRHQRFVTYPDNLRLWLEPIRTHGPIVPLNPMAFRRQWKIIRQTAAIFDTWPHDALRHSFATYHLAMYQNAPLTAHELGHPNPGLLYTHYRNLATRNDAALYWNLTPETITNGAITP